MCCSAYELFRTLFLCVCVYIYVRAVCISLSFARSLSSLCSFAFVSFFFDLWCSLYRTYSSPNKFSSIKFIFRCAFISVLCVLFVTLSLFFKSNFFCPCVPAVLVCVSVCVCAYRSVCLYIVSFFSVVEQTLAQFISYTFQTLFFSSILSTC